MCAALCQKGLGKTGIIGGFVAVKRMKRWGVGCLAVCLFLALTACGGKGQLLPTAQTAEEFKQLLSQQLTAYSDHWKTFSDNLESFYDTVQRGEPLERQESYRSLRDALQTWCEGLESYDEDGVFDLYRPLYEKIQELVRVTRIFFKNMGEIVSVSDMETVVDAFVQDASQLLADLSEKAKKAGTEADDVDWVVGKWAIEEDGTQHIYEYQADGTMIFPDGSQYIWRRKGSEEEEDATVWKTKCDETDAQIYYISVNGSDVFKEVVRQKEDGTLQVVKAVIYSTEAKVFTYIPVQ